MAMIRAIGRSILHKFPSPSQSQPRWLSTATSNTKKETPEVKEPSRIGTLYEQMIKGHHTSGVADILNEWVKQGHQVKGYDINKLCGHFRRVKNFGAALQVFDWVETSNISLNNGHHAIRIDFLSKSRGLASAEEYFNSLPASEKTGKTYGALLGCYCKGGTAGDAFKAMDLFDKMNELNHVSTLNYNNMMLLFYSLRLPEKVLHLVQEMEAKKIALDQYSYNTLINSYATLKDLDSIEGVLEKMNINKFEQDAFTCGNLATIYFDAGLHDKARAYLEKIEECENLKAGELFETCRTRLKLYSEMNDLSGVDRAWKALHSGLRTPPTNTKYLLMLIALSKLGEQERLEKLYKEWEDRSRAFDFRLANVLLNFYLSRGMIEKASSLHNRLVGKEGHNLRALDLLANVCIRKGKVDLALDYLNKGFDKEKPVNRKLFPSFETIDVFAKYFEENNNDRAKKRFAEAMKRMSREIPSSLLSRIQVSDE